MLTALPYSFLDGAFGQGVEEHPNADRRRTPGGGAAPHGHLFGPALLALLGGHPAFAGFGGMPRGQMGDYAFDQEGTLQLSGRLLQCFMLSFRMQRLTPS